MKHEQRSARVAEVKARGSRMSEWGQRTLHQADSEQMDVGEKGPGRIGGGSRGLAWSEDRGQHQALVLELRPAAEKG